MRLALLACLLAPAAAAQEAAPVRALFLGDQGHHRPTQLRGWLAPALRPRGVRITYTEDISDLDADVLSGYDCLIVYANIDVLPAESERALLDFVAGGGGLVALHCASYCFRNSEAWIELVGAQFLRHGYGVFRTEIVERDHPVTRGFMAFESTDETYVHHRHNPERTVLSYRVDGEHREPWTWVREHGKGRVFYTAWGHDEATWMHPGFEDLVERGVRWAAGDRFVRPRPPLESFEYVEALVPSYPPSPTWGVQDEPQRTMQKPLSPAASREYAIVPTGFGLELFAAEPDVVCPLTMAWDERGRLFVVESLDYPNDLGAGRDRIRICEDTDGDGVADRFRTFAEGLSIPTSLVRANGGWIVHQAPQTLFLADRDGDDVADERRVLFEGWGTLDTHAGPSNLRLGLDSWIWGTVGYSGFEGEVGGERHSFRQAVYRFRPDGSKLEVLGSTTNNTWGLGIDETGEVFCSTANSDHANHLAIPNRFYEGVRGWHAGGGLAFIGDYRAMHPITDRVRQVDWHGRFTAAAGFAVYTARAFAPAGRMDYWNRIAFVCEPTGHLVAQVRLERQGSGFVAHDAYNLFASRDEWTAPIFADVGPDGAVWVIDWYSYIVQHNPTPREFRTGKGNAYETPLRDKEHGRIWRVVPPFLDEPPTASGPDAARPDSLVEALRHPNMLWRLHAQRLLVERGERDVVPALTALAASEEERMSVAPAAVHALWTLHGLGVFERSDATSLEILRAAARHPDWSVRKTAAAVAPRDAKARDELLAAGLLEGHGLVRRAALLALAEMPPSADAGAEVFRILGFPTNSRDDRWIPDAATAAAARHDTGFLCAALASSAGSERAPRARREPPNLLPNPSFEELDGELPAGWRVRGYSGPADHRVAAGGRTGERCLEISSEQGSDTSWFADVDVRPGTTYRLSGWIRTEGIEGVGRAFGALMNVHAMPQPTVTPAVTGTEDWRLVECTFDSGPRERLSVNCLLGGWGRARGVAWWDDVALVEVDPVLEGLPPAVGRVVGVVTRHYAARGPADSVVAILDALPGADPALAEFVLEGLASGWPADAPLERAALEPALFSRLRAALPPSSLDRFALLTRKLGAGAADSADLDAARASLRARLSDEELSDAERLDAARRLLRLDAGEASIDVVLEELRPEAAPEWNRELVEVLAASESARVAGGLLERWSSLTPAVRRAASAVLQRRPAWCAALLGAVEGGAIDPRDLAVQDWQRLEAHPDAALAARAKSARGHGHGARAASADRQAVLERLLPLAAQDGDAARGRAVFEELCATCHAFDDFTGEVGPSLAGIGARGREELLAEIIDPNRSLESTYRVWTVLTADGRLFAGRLARESRTTLELLESTGARHVVERAEIDALQASDVSIMPEGLLDDRGPGDVTGLLEYLTNGSETSGGDR